MNEKTCATYTWRDDSAVFSSMFTQYYEPILSYLYRMVGNREAAEDLAQETFLKAYRALTRGDNLEYTRSWLYRVATNTAISYFRRQRLRRWLPFGNPQHEPVVNPRLAERVGEAELIDMALRRINPGYRSVLLLRHRDDLSIEEITAALGLKSTGATKVRLVRARQAFAREYRALAGEREDRP